MRVSFLAILLLSLVTWVSATISPRQKYHLQARALPLPQQDPFYTPPNGWKSKKHGEILRSRQVDVAFLNVDKYNLQAYQLLYRTSGTYESDDNVTVATVLIPQNAKKDQLVSYTPYIDASGPQCAPSYSMRLGSKLLTDPAMAYQQLLFSILLDKGYTIVIPDYQGPSRAFAVGRMEGRMVLDGIRATLNFDKAGLSKDTKIVEYGYSGGAIASGWTAALHSTYAPELNFVGFAMGGTPANLTGTVYYLNGGFFSGFAIGGVVGVMNAYENVRDWARKQNIIKANGFEAIDFTNSHCMVDILLKYPGINFLGDYFVTSGADLMHEPIVKNITTQLTMGLNSDETPKAPVWMFHGKVDEVIPYDDALAAAHAWSSHGADVLFSANTDPYMEHLTTELLNNANILFFIEDRMAGKPFHNGFKMETVSNPLSDPRVDLEGLDSLRAAIVHLLGQTFGMGDRKLKNDLKTNARN